VSGPCGDALVETFAGLSNNLFHEASHHVECFERRFRLDTPWSPSEPGDGGGTENPGVGRFNPVPP